MGRQKDSNKHSNPNTPPIEKGGLGILDIPTRNKAIDFTWTKRYMVMNENRPVWACVADILIQKSIPTAGGKHVDERVASNPFLQKWKPALQGKNRVTKVLQTMLKIAIKYNINIKAIRVSDKEKMNLPAWYHIGSQRHTTECLKTTHNLRTISNAIKTTRRTRDAAPNHTHRPRSNCVCSYCKDDRAV